MKRIKHKLNAGNTKKLIASGALESVVIAMEEHIVSEYVAAAAASAIGGLAKDEPSRDRLGKLDACQAIILAFKTHFHNDFVVPECASAINDLSVGHEANKSIFSSSDPNVVVLLLRSMNTHDHSSHVAYTCLQALITLSTIDENKRKMKSKSACNVYCRALQTLYKDELVVEWFGHMIYCIADKEDATRFNLGEENACTSLITGFTKHISNKSVAEWSFKALVSLSALESNRIKFFTSG